MFGYAKVYYMIKTGWQSMESSELDEEKEILLSSQRDPWVHLKKNRL